MSATATSRAGGPGGGPRPTDGASFSSAALVALVHRALATEDPALVPPDFDARALSASGRTGIEIKRALLEHAHRRAGPGPLLRVGRALSAMRDHPTVAVLTSTPDTDVLADKWRRLERYHHSAHRTTIDTGVPGRWTCTHVSRTGSAPLASEHALLCGLLLGLLSLVGARDARRVTDDDGDRVADGPRQRFTLGWDAHSAPAPGRAPGPSDGADPVACVVALIDADIGRHWRLDALGRRLGASPRSVQRSLAAAGTSFSALVHERRVRAASRLLRDTDRALADIGFECGFADQAHFQRTFSRFVNVTPRTYRQLSRD